MIHENAGETRSVVVGGGVERREGPCGCQDGDASKEHRAQLRLGVWIEIFTISWMTIDAAIAIITGYATHSVSLGTDWRNM